MATDIIARGMAANAKKSVTELGNQIESEKWIGTKAEWEAVDKSTIKDGTIVYITDDKTVILYDKAEMEKIATQVATDRKAAETAAQTAQAVADSLPEDYTTAVGKIAENTAEIGRVKQTDKELTRRVNALYDMGQGITHQFETDSETAYQKAVPTGAKLMSVKNIGGRSIVFNQLADVTDIIDETLDAYYTETVFNGNRPKWTKGHRYIFEFYAKSSVEPFGTAIGYSNKENVPYTRDGISVSGMSTGRKLLLFTPDDSLIDSGYQYIGVRPVRYDTRKHHTISVKNLMIFDLTVMFGSGNEPTTVEEFEAMFPEDYYPYNAGEIVSAGVTEVEYGLFGRNLYNHSELKKNGYVKFHVVGGRQLYRSNTLGRTVDWTLFSKTGTKIGTFEDLNFKSGTAFNLPDNADYIISIDTYSANAKTYIGYNPDTTYVPYDDGLIAYPIPEAIRNLPGYCIEGNTVDYEAKTYTQNNTIDGTEIKALDTPIVTDISTMLPDDFLRNIEVEALGSVTFKSSNDNYHIPVPSEEEYIVKLSEVGGTT
jgi:hypothetical protein